MKFTRKAFSFVELLVTFALLAIVITVVTPRYLGLQYNTNLRVAEQQVDTVRKAVLAWSSSQASLSDVSKNYGAETNIDRTVFLQYVMAEYLDPSFASRIKLTPGSGNTLAYFTTAEMENVAGTIAPTNQKYGNTGIDVPVADNPPKDSRNQFTAYGVIYWPVDPLTRRNYQPGVVLFYPKP